MRVRMAVVCAFALALFSLAAGCSKTEAPKPEAPPAVPATTTPAATSPEAPAAGGAVTDGKVLFEQKCGVCHDLARSTSRTDTKEGWTSIVKEMQGKKAGWISDGEAAKIAEFLTAEHGNK
jgi:cytochrome c5